MTETPIKPRRRSRSLDRGDIKVIKPFKSRLPPPTAAEMNAGPILGVSNAVYAGECNYNLRELDPERR